MPSSTEIPLLGLDRAELGAMMEARGEPGYRGQQVSEALYRQRVHSIGQISNLPQGLRTKVENQGEMVGLHQIEKRCVSQDATVLYLMLFADDQSVETFWMPEGDGGESGDGSEAGDD